MPDPVPEMITFEISLQATGAGSSKMYRALIVKDGNACELKDIPSIVEQFISGIKTGGFFAVFDLRRANVNGAVSAAEAAFDAPKRPESVTRIHEDHPIFNPKPDLASRLITDIPEAGITLKGKE